MKTFRTWMSLAALLAVTLSSPTIASAHSFPEKELRQLERNSLRRRQRS